jgi:hypothetical protein
VGYFLLGTFLDGRRIDEAVELLRREGFAAHHMEQGVADWRARGWQIATLVRAARAGVAP